MAKKMRTTRRQRLRRVSPFAEDANGLCVAEKAAFKARMKGHYRGEFNAAALLRQRVVEDEEDD